MYVYELPYVQNEILHQKQGCFLSLPAAYRKPSFCEGINPYGAFCEEKILECSILYQVGIVYKKENIWLINSMLCEIFLENIVRA